MRRKGRVNSVVFEQKVRQRKRTFVSTAKDVVAGKKRHKDGQ